MVWSANILIENGEVYTAMQKYGQFIVNELMNDADLVITDGYSIACILRYDEKVNKAPLIMGMTEDYDEVALFLERARIYQVYCAENPPLARVIYMNHMVGEEICPQIYQSVADELSKALKMNKHRGEE